MEGGAAGLRRPRELLGLALRAAGRAGQEIMGVYSGQFAVDAKEDRTPITEADRRAHRAGAPLERDAAP